MNAIKDPKQLFLCYSDIFHRAELEKFKKDNKPVRMNGLYALYNEKKTKEGSYFDVVYVGMSNTPSSHEVDGKSWGGIIWRLTKHRQNKDWTHFRMFVHPKNITPAETEYLEALNLIIFKTHSQALNKKGSKSIEKWSIDKIIENADEFRVS